MKVINKEEKFQLVRQVQIYFEEQQMETIGNLATEQLIDYMMEILGPHAYNEALADVQKTLKAHSTQLEDALFLLEKSTRVLKK